MILKFDDLVSIANEIDNVGAGEEGLTVLIPVRNRDLFIKINEEFHYRFAQEGELDKNVEEINISIGKTIFRYYLDENLEVE